LENILAKKQGVRSNGNAQVPCRRGFSASAIASVNCLLEMLRIKCIWTTCGVGSRLRLAMVLRGCDLKKYVGSALHTSELGNIKDKGRQ
jgi:hypothetical protein